jgi:hypothetical protein
MGVADAVRLLQTAETVEAAPDTLDALKAGKVSTRQAKAIGAAESVDPAAGQHLLASAEGRSTRETQNDAARIVAAASTESPAAKAERHRTARRVFHGVNADGMGFGSWLLPIAEHARIVAQLDGERAEVFDQARGSGVRESADAYTADAFCRVFDRAGRRGDGRPKADGETSGEAVEDWSFTKVIVRVDLGALDRGELAAREVGEIAGQGPIPVGDAWRMIDGGAFIAAVTTDGTEIDKVIHLGRKPTVLQRTALEWFSAWECSTEGCTSPARIEIDHVADWADTHITTLPDLASPCGHCHDLKTHHGHTFGPRLPSGKHRLIPPDQSPPGATDPPRDRIAPGLTLLQGEADPEARTTSSAQCGTSWMGPFPLHAPGPAGVRTRSTAGLSVA